MPIQVSQIGTVEFPETGSHVFHSTTFYLKKFQIYDKVKKMNTLTIHTSFIYSPNCTHFFATFASSHSLHIYTYIYYFAKLFADIITPTPQYLCIS